jgi:hypothetical protein
MHKETKTSLCETSTSKKEMEMIYDRRCQLGKGISKELCPILFSRQHIILYKTCKECHLHINMGHGKNDSWKCIMKRKIK